MELLVTEKNIMQPLRTEKVTQPLGTKKNHATSWDKKNPATSWYKKKSHNLLGQKNVLKSKSQSQSKSRRSAQITLVLFVHFVVLFLQNSPHLVPSRWQSVLSEIEETENSGRINGDFNFHRLMYFSFFLLLQIFFRCFCIILYF